MAFTRRSGQVNEVEDAIAALSSAFGSPVELTEVDDSTIDAGGDLTATEAEVINSIRTSVIELQNFLVEAGLAVIEEDA